jgi:hypothetical protein
MATNLLEWGMSSHQCDIRLIYLLIKDWGILQLICSKISLNFLLV